MIRALANAAISVLLAPYCACCGAALATPAGGAVCDACWSAVPNTVPPLCDLCGDALPSWRQLDLTRRCNRCRRTGRVISLGRSIGPYEGVLRDMLHALKYERRQSLARPLGGLMRRAGAEALQGAELVVPVPLHLFRLYARGFNQADALARHLGLPVVNALRRTRRTVTQTDLPEGERHANVRGAFALRRAVPANGVVVVVDDVSTTGATLDACAAVLIEAGVREVRGLTAARAAARLP